MQNDAQAMVLTTEGVAALLGIDTATFLARRPRMVREHGFPRCLPGLPGRWPRLQVEHWINSGGNIVPEAEKAGHETGFPALPAGRTSSFIRDQRAALQQRYSRTA